MTPDELYPKSADELPPLKAAVSDLFGQIPETWEVFDFESLSSMQQRALHLLTVGGLVERQVSLRVFVPDGRFGCNIVCAVTGWRGWDLAFNEVSEDILATTYEDWRRWNDSPDATPRPVVRSESVGAEKWRLTDQGEIAKSDLHSSDDFAVKNFWAWVFHRDFFAFRDLYEGAGRIIQRIDDARPVTAQPVHVTNPADIAEEVKAAILSEILAGIKEGFSAQIDNGQTRTSQKKQPKIPKEIEALRFANKLKQKGKPLQVVADECNDKFGTEYDKESIGKAINRADKNGHL